MSKTAIRIIPYGSFDIPGLEGWLEKLAGRGLRYSSAFGPLALFDRAEPRRVQVHLEPIQGRAAEDPELNALYEAVGWDYWGMFRNGFFVYAAGDLSAQAHTDRETWGYALRRFFRQALTGGLLLALLNVLFLSLYHKGAIWDIDWTWMRYFPVESLSDGATLPFLLCLAAFALLDLNYLLGLVQLARCRRAVHDGRAIRGLRTGWLNVPALVLLLPVLVNTVQLYLGLDYSPCDLEGSGFVTLTEIEGEDFRLSGDSMYNMDYISHGGTLLDPESWYFRQYASFSQHDGGLNLNDVPRLEIRAVRYPLKILAQLRAEKMTGILTNSSNDWVDLGPVEGTDQAFYALREERTHTNELTGQTRTFLPGGELVLRKGNTVLYADYYGHQDSSDYLPAFVRTLNSL